MPLRPVSGGVSLRLRVTPRGGADRIDGLAADASGEPFLRVRVSAVAEKGKANDAVLKLLARALRLPRSAFAVASGEAGRTKSVTISGDTERLMADLGDWLAHLEKTPG
ncbi:protein of unknown function DUF167 [Parvibaculum lavamentivorans DS-1]|uniref:UPF0235 protein Plav_1371 n=1 Tax=Parvibaculum lavamentivorans (strain DS-1 / DSM 13023 / NCIMB 13966) TaxID=402881 RepID=A7HSV8_PARL1|nr:DUF167 family protein [Parvibaculum lavamentivorans]ABS62991.1 protein of unknown function DUF167 [Parvibaculum lavamentivorans DS-1]